MTDADNPGVPFAPPLSFVFPLLPALLLEWLVPTHILGGALRWATGVLLVGTGLALVLAGAATQRRAGTDFLPERPSTTIVSHGVYARTRNPMYVGFAIGMLGLALLIDSVWVAFAVPIGVLIIDRVIVLREERYLERKFGPDYLAYKRRVRRWL